MKQTEICTSKKYYTARQLNSMYNDESNHFYFLFKNSALEGPAEIIDGTEFPIVIKRFQAEGDESELVYIDCADEFSSRERALYIIKDEWTTLEKSSVEFSVHSQII